MHVHIFMINIIIIDKISRNLTACAVAKLVPLV